MVDQDKFFQAAAQEHLDAAKAFQASNQGASNVAAPSLAPEVVVVPQQAAPEVIPEVVPEPVVAATPVQEEPSP